MEKIDLFQNSADDIFTPLARRMRPQKLAEFVGQEDIFGKGKYIRKMIEEDKLLSLILWGPPGTGKTTIAEIIALHTHSIFQKINAVSAGIAEIKKVIEEAKKERKFYLRRTILFIDEIHRFNKSQQDILLPYVEEGSLTLIGATTENPFFEVNTALLSRLKVLRLVPLSSLELVTILKNALSDKERGLGKENLLVKDDVLEEIANFARGDARHALNLLEQLAFISEGEITLQTLDNILGEKRPYYDKKGDMHYDVVSAFIKSMRGSEPNAALHYLARMLVGGEDLLFIARRIVICAAEDVGLADPHALVVAEAAARAVHFVGMPEARIILAEAVVYVSTAPKSNAGYVAIDKAINDIKNMDVGSVPLHMRDRHYAGAKKLRHGEDYLYPHDFSGNFVEQNYLPTTLQGASYYKPTKNGYEKEISSFLEAKWKDRK